MLGLQGSCQPATGVFTTKLPQEEKRDEPLVEKLEMLLSIILESPDEDKDGAISKKDSPAGARRSRTSRRGC